MHKQLTINALVIAGAVLHHFLFWNENMGVNTLLFAIFLVGTLLWLNPEALQSRSVRVTATGTLLTAAMVVVNNSLFAKTVHTLSFLCLIGFVQARELRFLFYAICLGFWSLFQTPIKAFEQFRSIARPSTSYRLGAQVKMWFIALPVVAVFFSLYAFANDKFAEVSYRFFDGFLNFFFQKISVPRLLFFLFGIVLTGGAIWKTAAPKLLKWQQRQGFSLFLSRKKKAYPTTPPSTLGLKKEFRTALLLAVLLNVLLFFVNLVDISYVWLGNVPEDPYSLKIYVHEGTYVLIGAILLAMAVLLFFFRRNLNFLSGNKPLQIAAYIWIAQNAFLALTVGLRNYHYIDLCGLAYKRIGVFIFLLLTLYGLFTMFLKINKLRSVYFLLFQNSYALYFVLLAASLVSWDTFITRYNIFANTKNPIDIKFLMEDISDKNLYLLTENKEIISRKLPPNISADYFEDKLKYKWLQFDEKINGTSWLSWNLVDAKNLKMRKLQEIRQ